MKEGPLKLNQVIKISESTEEAEQHYFFDDVNVSATDTVERHLKRIDDVVADADVTFSST
ncbi:MAG: hypothetical protein O2968_23465 [Acidobacteria bacterium]|nr:hypothetical protein [Acidobacteriota bacterium]